MQFWRLVFKQSLRFQMKLCFKVSLPYSIPKRERENREMSASLSKLRNIFSQQNSTRLLLE